MPRAIFLFLAPFLLGTASVTCGNVSPGSVDAGGDGKRPGPKVVCCTPPLTFSQCDDQPIEKSWNVQCPGCGYVDGGPCWPSGCVPSAAFNVNGWILCCPSPLGLSRCP